MKRSNGRAGGLRYANVDGLTVVRRRREVGLRMALGATGTRVVTLVMRDGLLLVAIGIAVGVPAALASGRAAGSLLFQLSPYDAVSLVVHLKLREHDRMASISRGSADPFLARGFPRCVNHELTRVVLVACHGF